MVSLLVRATTKALGTQDNSLPGLLVEAPDKNLGRDREVHGELHEHRKQRENERCPHGNMRQAPVGAFDFGVCRVPVFALLEHAVGVNNTRSNVNEVEANFALVGQGTIVQPLVLIGAFVAHLIYSCSPMVFLAC